MKDKKLLFIHTEEGHSNQMYAIGYYALLAAEAGNDVALLGPVIPHARASRIPSLADYPVLSRRGLGKFAQLFRRYHSFVTSVIRFKPDIIHVRNHVGATLLPLLLKLIRPSGKIILDLRTLSPNPRKHQFFLKTRAINTRLFDHSFGLNQAILDAYATEIGKSSVLPAGYDKEIFYPRGRLKYRAGDELKCLYFGSMNRVRVMDRLLESIVMALQAGIRLRVDLVGEGEDRARLEAEIPQQYRENIRVLPFHDQTSLADSFPQYHLGLAYVPGHAALAPNIPLKTIELLACGMPVIATDTPGNLRLVEDGGCGLLVQDDATSMFEAFRRCAEGEWLGQVSDEDCLSAVADFTWEMLAEIWLYPVYEKLLAGKA